MPVARGVEDLVTVREAASIASRTPETVRRWVWSGRLPARRDGNRLLLRRLDVERLARGDDLQAGEADRRSLVDWAELVRTAIVGGSPGTSAADLVLADRDERERIRASR